jgi:S-adenosylmethionine:tRNA ribosyltransferase-isomerase
MHHKIIKMQDININDYDYDLPEDRIAQYPVSERDKSQLLVFKNNEISKDIFYNIDTHLPSGSLLVFNNTRVIRARILFRKVSGAAIEVLCIEPLNPFDYSQSFGSKQPVEWKCIVGNLKKWKSGTLSTPFTYKGRTFSLNADKQEPDGDSWRIKFMWDCSELSFGEVIELTGHIPLPPYIKRDDEEEDLIRYQTVYSRIDGSVAAPTAGLHFTETVFKKIQERGIKTSELTLHVGAGTFKPVKSNSISDHEMHCEHFSVDAATIETLIGCIGNIIPVGTTSVRTLESLYWLGARMIQKHTEKSEELSVAQWEAYETESIASAEDSLVALLDFMKRNNLTSIQAATSIIIVPGYKFMLTNGIITNFHQPRSTLLLLISAWTGKRWEEIYFYALKNGFRFLSYGDSSLLL